MWEFEVWDVEGCVRSFSTFWFKCMLIRGHGPGVGVFVGRVCLGIGDCGVMS